jgi:hypothetical protein
MPGQRNPSNGTQNRNYKVIEFDLTTPTENDTMNRFSWLAVVLIVTLLVKRVDAQGTMTWSANYPKTSGGAAAKSISIKGTIATDAGWTVKSVSAYFAEANKVETEYKLKFTQTTWPIDAMNKWSDDQNFVMDLGKTDYWVVVRAEVSDGTITRYLRAMPVKVKSSP